MCRHVYRPLVALFRNLSVPMDQQPQNSATQSTNPFSIARSSYQARLSAVGVKIPAQASADKLSGVAADKVLPEQQGQQPQQNNLEAALHLPDCMSQLQMSENDEGTRLLLLPSDPDALNLEPIGISGGDPQRS